MSTDANNSDGDCDGKVRIVKVKMKTVAQVIDLDYKSVKQAPQYDRRIDT